MNRAVSYPATIRALPGSAPNGKFYRKKSGAWKLLKEKNCFQTRTSCFGGKGMARVSIMQIAPSSMVGEGGE